MNGEEEDDDDNPEDGEEDDEDDLLDDSALDTETRRMIEQSADSIFFVIFSCLVFGRVVSWTFVGGEKVDDGLQRRITFRESKLSKMYFSSKKQEI